MKRFAVQLSLVHKTCYNTESYCVVTQDLLLRNVWFNVILKTGYVTSQTSPSLYLEEMDYKEMKEKKKKLVVIFRCSRWWHLFHLRCILSGKVCYCVYKARCSRNLLENWVTLPYCLRTSL